MYKRQTPHSVYVDTTDGDKQYTVSASNSPLPSLKITKADAQTCLLYTSKRDGSLLS